eukprot:46522_1
MDEKIEIDEFESIQHLIQNKNIDVTCPNNMNQTHCLPMIRLFKVLREYNVSLQRLLGLIDTPLRPDSIRISNNQYQTIFVECAKSIGKLSNDAFKILVNYIPDYRNFLKMSRKQFVHEIRKQCKIKPSISNKLCKIIKNRIRKLAPEYQFNEFVSNVPMENIEEDYHHILSTHIHQSNTNCRTNALKLFSMIHCDDSDLTLYRLKCGNVEIRDIYRRNKNNVEIEHWRTSERRIDYGLMDRCMQTPQAWSNQSQLDTIHRYLVHPLGLCEPTGKHFIRCLTKYNICTEEDKDKLQFLSLFKDTLNDKDLMRDEICKSINKNDQKSTLYEILYGSLHFGRRKRQEIYDILLHEYFKLVDLNVDNIIILSRIFMCQLKLENEIDAKAFISIVRKKQLDGEALTKLDTTNFVLLFAPDISYESYNGLEKIYIKFKTWRPTLSWYRNLDPDLFVVDLNAQKVTEFITVFDATFPNKLQDSNVDQYLCEIIDKLKQLKDVFTIIDKLKQLKDVFTKHGSTMFQGAANESDITFKKLLYIGHENIGVPYLHLLADLYGRDRINHSSEIVKLRKKT